MSHDHEYMHAHGIPHDHAENCNHCASGCANCDADPRAEAIALMRYMVNHNAAHANELAQLAERLKAMGEDAAFEQVTRAVSDFEQGNLRLTTVLAALTSAQ